ncbi:substrate-binding periplasmic protein [Microbulbifer sp. CnH-101-E]|uniref:substrate-binding periplasmic protein n=1 Tax=unclassified Microbulbifer TaxID=2619833 RepID=UPI0040393238
MPSKILSHLSLLLICFAFSSHAKELKIAISQDAPPYVINQAKSGLEVDVITQSLPDYTISFIQMGWGEILGAIERGMAEAEANVHGNNGDLYYSNDYIAFINYAISRKKDQIKINQLKDLVGHHVITWTGAHKDLGPEFSQLFSPGKIGAKNYVELESSQDQVREFWREDNSIIIIDKSIFSYFSSKDGHSMNEVDIHTIVVPVLTFKMAFKNKADRDAFNHGLRQLCNKGIYEALLKRYSVAPEANICKNLSQ